MAVAPPLKGDDMDVEFNVGDSIANLPITDPIHKPCPDMEGMNNPTPERRENSLFHLNIVREKLGFKEPQKDEPSPLHYTCTKRGCIEPWGDVNNVRN